tara:strand:+ start:174 stop:362 length:189 start_codon:yes stop_codon:yes gene_type:complete
MSSQPNNTIRKIKDTNSEVKQMRNNEIEIKDKKKNTQTTNTKIGTIELYDHFNDIFNDLINN